jgi:hypothetical protein
MAMAKPCQNRKTRHRRGGGPKSRKSKSTKNVTAKKDSASRSPGSPERCGICLEGMSDMKLTKNTKCGHRFHKECLGMWCDSRKKQGMDTLCPFCKKAIKTDCAALEPGQPIPEHRLRDLLSNEAWEALQTGFTGLEIADRRKRMKEFLEELRFPKKFKYDDWNKITHFRKACDEAINFEQVRDFIARKYA